MSAGNSLYNAPAKDVSKVSKRGKSGTQKQPKREVFGKEDICAHLGRIRAAVDSRVQNFGQALKPPCKDKHAGADNQCADAHIGASCRGAIREGHSGLE